MTADERLELIKVKVARAKTHLSDLEVELKAFLETKPYVIGTKRDPQTRRVIYFLASVQDTPLSVAAIAGEVLQNLRSGLDHLAYQLVLVGTGKAGPFFHVYFPIYDSEAEYNAKKHARVKGMRQDAIQAIDRPIPTREVMTSSGESTSLTMSTSTGS